MSKTPTTSKKAKVLSALQSGQKVSRKSASRYKLVNLRATIADLRNNDGYENILTNYNNAGEVYYTLS